MVCGGGRPRQQVTAEGQGRSPAATADREGLPTLVGGWVGLVARGPGRARAAPREGRAGLGARRPDLGVGLGAFPRFPASKHVNRAWCVCKGRVQRAAAVAGFIALGRGWAQALPGGATPVLVAGERRDVRMSEQAVGRLGSVLRRQPVAVARGGGTPGGRPVENLVNLR